MSDASIYRVELDLGIRDDRKDSAEVMEEFTDAVVVKSSRHPHRDILVAYNVPVWGNDFPEGDAYRKVVNLVQAKLDILEIDHRTIYTANIKET